MRLTLAPAFFGWLPFRAFPGPRRLFTGTYVHVFLRTVQLEQLEGLFPLHCNFRSNYKQS
jgi:hypothetical protein